MKFGKQLQIQANPEWLSKYVHYKQLKKIIDQIAAAEKGDGDEKNRTSIGSEEEGAGGSSPLEDTPLLTMRFYSKRVMSHPNMSDREADLAGREKFWNMLQADLNMVNEFYEGQIAMLQLALTEVENKELPHHRKMSVQEQPDSNSGFRRLLEIYETMCELKLYCGLNFQGFRKIVKKLEKSAPKVPVYEEFLVQLKKETFVKGKVLDNLLSRVNELVSADKLVQVEKAVREKHSLVEGAAQHGESFRWCVLLFSISLLLVCRFTPMPSLFGSHHTHGPPSQRCLSVLAFACCMWVGHGAPYFATAMMIPVLVVMFDVLVDEEGYVMSRKEAAKLVTGHMLDHTSILILGGFAVSAAFCRVQIELRIADKLQTWFGHKPRLFILSLMLLGCFLSMWIGNHTAPILIISFLMPTIRDFPPGSPFSKCLLLGIAFSCNVGGMMTPISSLQNILAVSSLDREGTQISFGQWMMVSIPFCTLAVFAAWLFLIFSIPPVDCEKIPKIVFKKKPFTIQAYMTLFLTSTTIVLWAFLPESLGDVSIVALSYMVVVFGSGMLTVLDFNSFNWNLIFLIGGGSVLGQAVQSSQLLDILSHVFLDLIVHGYNSHHTPDLSYLQLAVVIFKILSLLLLFTSFISHTVAAIILMPLMAKIGHKIGAATLLTMLSAFTISSAMALPFSSFPNLNSFLVKDDFMKPYLHVGDFLKLGIPFQMVLFFLILTMGSVLVIVIAGLDS
eukprot:gb/GEZN01003013.1/.p1 GENE.gb/GEZN01003013.1/~~gb/GEZN01003013.1/.p1  ORF type:complete len:730 (-),score=80.64 gb/GEZN01003013.1/:15-2204(-)